MSNNIKKITQIEGFGVDMEGSIYELYEIISKAGNKLYVYANILDETDPENDTYDKATELDIDIYDKCILIAFAYTGEVFKEPKHPWGEKYTQMMKRNIEDLIMMEHL
jgi:hypothetical protein